MGSGYFGDYEDIPEHRNTQGQSLLKSGWRPLSRDLDLGFLTQLVLNDPMELTRKTLDLVSDLANTLGRRDHTWWANLLNVFSENTRYEIDEYWDYITPAPPGPDYRYKDTLSTETPINQKVSRNHIPIEYVLSRLQEITVLKVLDILGRPDIITQTFGERHFYYPVGRFIDWNRLESLGTLLAYWSEYHIWLQITNGSWGRRRYMLIAKELAPLVNKATYNLAVMLSGYQSRVGQVQSLYPLRSFPTDIQSFTDQVQQAILSQNQLAVLVHGEPGTGKTAWTQAVASEILVSLRYVIFILDHDAVENFVPPNYLERICLIINEADNLAQDRATEIAQRSNKTEHILSLLDGTLYQSVVEASGIQADQRLVVLMTCNTTERLDPAMLRKGRVDLMYEFTHKFV
ncbi:AAA family ATPase [Leptolyngbya sp. 'hensonii']|uniref:AAA family ATPase n=1 Tax=Leptolyngbya sp. 'hensonii' TaxID=1922337 RepID=UPI00094F664C|nr:AAA family ATPase [Leptolyngbya sp. 'hensonii']OLP16852.1 AAA family ATPase [Leptolyngbya sp. 'hensonii']